MQTYELIKKEAAKCRKYGDNVLVFLENNEFYLESFGGLKRLDTVIDGLSDEGAKIQQYIQRYNGNGVELKVR